MNYERRKTVGFKPILVSPETHARLAEMTTKNRIYNDVITELLNNGKIIRSEVLREQQVGPLGLAVPESKGELRPHG